MTATLSPEATELARFNARADRAESLDLWEERRVAELLKAPLTADDLDNALDRALLEKLAAHIQAGRLNQAMGVLLLQLASSRQASAEQQANDEAFELSRGAA